MEQDQGNQANKSSHLGTSDPVTIRDAVSALSEADQVIAYLAKTYGDPILDRTSLADFTVPGEQSPATSHEERLFADLVDIIIHQQLAGKAAVAISIRLKEAVGRITPEALATASGEALSAAGLSGAKVAAISGLSRAVLGGELLLGSLAEYPDEEVSARLCTMRGLGPWSAEMFLMFSLQRRDVWPKGDLGVRKGYAHSYQLAETPSPIELGVFGERFKPYRSLVAWYMWRSLSAPMPVIARLDE